MTAPAKHGGARPGAGQPRKPAELSVSVRLSVALTPAEAIEYKRRGATRWLRRTLQGASLLDAASATERPMMGHRNEKGD